MEKARPLPENVQMVNPTSYLVNIKSSGTFPIILPQGFDAGWQAYVNGSGLSSSQHFDAGGLVNGWVISCNGHCTMEIVFSPQSEALNLQLLSASFFVIIIVLVGLTWSRTRSSCVKT